MLIRLAIITIKYHIYESLKADCFNVSLNMKTPALVATINNVIIVTVT